jgi:hypothetical protein
MAAIGIKTTESVKVHHMNVKCIPDEHGPATVKTVVFSILLLILVI